MGHKKKIGLPGGPNEMINDSKGQWNHPGENTRIEGSDITMDGVPYPVWGQPNVGAGMMMFPDQNYSFPGAQYVDEYPVAQDGIEVPKRKGVRKNPDGSVSSHLMRTETLDGENWFSFPSLFQDKDGTWIDMSEEEDWMRIYEEAKKRNEVIDFGTNKEAAIKFGEGSWKSKMQKGGTITHNDTTYTVLHEGDTTVTLQPISGGSVVHVDADMFKEMKLGELYNLDKKLTWADKPILVEDDELREEVEQNRIITPIQQQMIDLNKKREDLQKFLTPKQKGGELPKAQLGSIIKAAGKYVDNAYNAGKKLITKPTVYPTRPINEVINNSVFKPGESILSKTSDADFDVLAKLNIPEDASYFSEYGAIAKKGESRKYEDVISDIKAAYDKNPVLNEAGFPVYFHGSRSGSLPGIIKNEGLEAFDALRKKGITPLGGEQSSLFYPSHINNDMISAVYIDNLDGALRYSGATNPTRNPFSFSDRMKDWDGSMFGLKKGKTKKFIEEYEPNMPGITSRYENYFKELPKTWDNLSADEKLLANENFPVLFGLNPKAGSASRFKVPQTDIRSEIGIGGKTTFDEIQGVFVPESFVDKTQTLFGDRAKVLPIESIVNNKYTKGPASKMLQQSEDFKKLKNWQWEHGGQLPKAQLGFFKKGYKYVDNLLRTAPKLVDDASSLVNKTSVPSVDKIDDVVAPSSNSWISELRDYNPFTVKSKKKGVEGKMDNIFTLQDDLLEQKSKNWDIINSNQLKIDRRNDEIGYQAGDWIYGLNNRAQYKRGLGTNPADDYSLIPNRLKSDPFNTLQTTSFPRYFNENTGLGPLTSPGFKLTPEGNISANLITDQFSNPRVFEAAGTLNTKGNILDFNTGNIIKGNIDTPIVGGTQKIIGPKGLINETTVPSGSYQLNPELTKLYDNNIKFAQDKIPGFQPLGSSLYGKLGVPHVTGDLDGIIIDTDWNKVKSKFNKLDNTKYGDKIELVTDPTKKGLGNVDVNILKTGEDGNATGELATELYRQFFPDEFYKSNENVLKGIFNDTKSYTGTGGRRPVHLQLEGKNLPINKTPQELIDAYDPEVKTILDAFESGAQGGNKAKHINRSELIMEYGDSEKVAKAQELYAKSIMGSKADIGKQFDPNVFDDYENNLKILNKINESGYNVGGGKYLPKDIAKDPAKMQLHLNDWYINNSIYTRRVDTDFKTMDNYDDLVSSYKNWISHGGEAHGVGLNTVKLGEPGRNYGNVVGNRQFKLYDDNVNNPLEYIDNVNNKISGQRKVGKDDFTKINDIANKHNITFNEGAEINNFGDLLDIRQKAITSSGNKGTKDVKNFLHDVGEEFGMKVITRGRHNMSEYSTVLGNIDDTIDNLAISLDKYSPQLKSKGQRATNLKQAVDKLDDRNLTEEMVNVDEITNDFKKIQGYLNGGLEVSEKRFKTLQKLDEKADKALDKSLENIKDKYYNKILNKATTEEKEIADAYFKKAKESGDLFKYLEENPIDDVLTITTGSGPHSITQKYPVLAKELAFIREAGEQNLKLKKELDYYNQTLNDLSDRRDKLEIISDRYKLGLGVGGIGGGGYLGFKYFANKSEKEKEERLKKKQKGGQLAQDGIEVSTAPSMGFNERPPSPPTKEQIRAKRLYNYIAPTSYSDPVNIMKMFGLEEALNNPVKTRTTFTDPRSEEFYKQYLGLPTESGFLTPTTNPPTNLNVDYKKTFSPNDHFFKLDEEMENAIYEIAMNELKDKEVRTLNQDILNDDKYKHLITKENSTDTNNLFSGLNNFTVRKTQNKAGEDIISYIDRYDFPADFIPGTPFGIYGEIPVKKEGGESNNSLDTYKKYVLEELTTKEDREKGKKIYDKLNRVYYKDAKKMNMNPSNYIMTYLITN